MERKEPRRGTCWIARETLGPAGGAAGLTGAIRATATARACLWGQRSLWLSCGSGPTPLVWIGPHAVVRDWPATHIGSIEAAHVLRTHLTEPTRFGRSSPTPCAALEAAEDRLLRQRHLRGRARRFAWPTRGTERFLGREPWPEPAVGSEPKERRRSAATRPGLTPYSCLAPPRLTTIGQSRERTPKPEPSRRGASRWVQRLPFGGIG